MFRLLYGDHHPCSLELWFIFGEIEYKTIPILLGDRLEDFNQRFRSRYVQLYRRKWDVVPEVFPPEIANTVFVVDGTDIPARRVHERKGKLQRFIYNKVIGYMALCLISPDRLLRAIYGPAPGATNDIKLTRDSRLIPGLEPILPYKAFHISK